ncbi:hypothetical protein EGY31_02765 [Burkholderia multivorans]|nr:hypothetical protein EGY31_02765 [Burkholderia multivorans]
MDADELMQGISADGKRRRDVFLDEIEWCYCCQVVATNDRAASDSTIRVSVSSIAKALKSVV